MDFPMFGICPVCGSDGGDHPATDLTGADAQDNIDETGQGVPLVFYQGNKMCEVCKNRLIADEESLESARRHSEEEARRAGMGFTKTIT
jgi:hypothetical protein